MKLFSGEIKQQLSELGEFCLDLHKDERGDNENLGRLLILALVLIPLIILIIFFGNDIVTKAKAAWTQVTGAPVTP